MLESIWEPYWTIFLGATGIIYLFVLLLITVGLYRLPKLNKQREDSKERPQVSIIIPCRNEAEHIGAALDDLAGQDYPSDRVQIVVVDDRSEDATGDIARKKIGMLPDLKVISVDTCPEDCSPKKNAISQGLKQAEGDIIITTDGDCRFKKGWIKALVGCFTPEIGVVTGLTVFNRDMDEPLWQQLQQMDYLSHSFFAAGAIGSGLVFNCNGSNLALKREAFEEIGGYEGFRQVVTGDDTLLIQRMKQSEKWHIHYCTHPDSIVRSWPEETPVKVLNQRLRWGSGGLSYSPFARSFAVVTFTFFLMLLLSPFLWLGEVISSAWIFFFLLKVVFEAQVMNRGGHVFDLKRNWLLFIFLELLHLPAIIAFSIGGHLWGFHWKGQRFRRTRSTPNVSGATTS